MYMYGTNFALDVPTRTYEIIDGDVGTLLHVIIVVCATLVYVFH